MPVDSVSPFRGPAACELPPTSGNLCDPVSLATSGKSDSDGESTYAAHSEGARSNESADPSRVE
jgi:hypothetical protein